MMLSDCCMLHADRLIRMRCSDNSSPNYCYVPFILNCKLWDFLCGLYSKATSNISKPKISADSIQGRPAIKGGLFSRKYGKLDPCGQFDHKWKGCVTAPNNVTRP